MKRGAIVTFDFWPAIGGQGRHTYEMWKRVRREPGLDLRVLSPLTNGLPKHQRVLSWTLRAGKHLAFSLAAAALIEHWRKQLDLDFVHVNGGPGGLLLPVRPNATVIYTVHHTYAQQARLAPGQRWKRAFIPLERASYRKADVVTGDCPSTTAALRDDLGIYGAFTVPSGVDTQVFRPLEVERVPNSLLYVGRLDARKGIELAVSAMPFVLARAPDATLYVVGRGPLETKMRDFAAREGVADRLVFLGRVSNDELVRWYNRASVVVVPSAFEGFGLTVLEAQACGTPVLATNVEGLRDLIDDMANGRLVPFGDPAALGKAAAELLNNHGLRRELSQAGLRQAGAYDWDRVAERWADVYRWAPEAPPSPNARAVALEVEAEAS